MATARDLDFTYTLIDRLFRLSLGEMADFSGAKYDGDFRLSLEDAQRRKHAYVIDRLGIRRGARVLDLGCGWGPLLNSLRQLGAVGIGVTLSRGQAAACRRNGLDVRIENALEVQRDTYGAFDAVASLGAFEHFCSPAEFQAGRQEQIYAGLFANVRTMLEPGQRLYLQTMVFGRNMIRPEDISLTAPRGSDAHVLGLLSVQFPGSWLPSGLDQIIRTAAPHFRLVESSSGRLDYIETIRQWRLRFGQFGWRKLAAKTTMLPRYLTSAEFRHAFTSGISPNGICFERELLDHFRIVFEAV
jgi:cyclopropane-fatty-acyl-phospholipid synthase